MKNKAEQVLRKLTDYILGSKYVTCPEITRCIYLGGAIALQLGSLPVYQIRKRQLGFDVGERKFKLRFRHTFNGVELVEWDGFRDIRVVKRITSLDDAHGILANL